MMRCTEPLTPNTCKKCKIQAKGVQGMKSLRQISASKTKVCLFGEYNKTLTHYRTGFYLWGGAILLI